MIIDMSEWATRWTCGQDGRSKGQGSDTVYTGFCHDVVHMYSSIYNRVIYCFVKQCIPNATYIINPNLEGLVSYLEDSFCKQLRHKPQDIRVFSFPSALPQPPRYILAESRTAILPKPESTELPNNLLASNAL